MSNENFEIDYAAIYALDLGWTGLVEFPPGYVSERHAHDHWEFMYVEKGGGRIETDIGDADFQEGALIVYPPCVSHIEYVSDAEIKLTILDILEQSGRDFLHFWPRDDLSHLVLTGTWLCDAFQSAMEKINGELAAMETAYMLRIRAYVYEFISFLYMHREQSRSSRAQEPEHIAKTKAYIEDHYATKLKLVDIAEHTYVSMYYLSHSFKAHTGDTPMNYLLSYRIKKAQELLVQCDFSITQVSEMVGYESLQHFSSNFHKRTGLTPREYRKKHKR